MQTNFTLTLLILEPFQSAMSFEAGMQPRRQSSSSSNHSFGHIASSHPYDSVRRSRHRHRQPMSPSALKKRQAGSPQVGGLLLIFMFLVVM